MKTRLSFVSNSSSTSYIILTSNDKTDELIRRAKEMGYFVEGSAKGTHESVVVLDGGFIGEDLLPPELECLADDYFTMDMNV